MTPRQRRFALVAGILAGVSVAALLAMRAFEDNVMFFFDPSQVATGEAPVDKRFRLGGMVRPGTVQRTPGSLEMSFIVTDFKRDVPVRYEGVVPDLFRENQGVVAHGRLGQDGTFVADEILAKHDENYMPPEVAKAIKEKHGGVMPVNPDHKGVPRT
ncbi:MAG: cytochrome c maturation protein CcmE [Gammaproteobacteria bacterium]|jgi:cytochrome c-type biogenesis protein CcmE